MAAEPQQYSSCTKCAAPYSAHVRGRCPQPAASSDAARAGGSPAAARVRPLAIPAIAGMHSASASSAWPPTWRRSEGLVTPGRRGNGQAVASLVFGILSVFFCWLGLIAVAMIILAAAFGAIGILRSRLGFSDGMAPAVAGLVLAGAGTGLYFVFGAFSLGLGFRI